MPRTGFTDDGDASMFSWLGDSDGSSSVGTELKYNADYFDPDWLIEHEFDDEVVAPARPVEDQGLNRGAVLAQQNRLLASMVDEEKCKNKELYDALINREIELAFQDQVIEELESKNVEAEKQKEALMCQLIEGKKSIDDVKVIAVACFSVALTLGDVLFCLFEKM